MMPTKIVKKDDVVALGRKAPKNKWMYKIAYSNEKEYLESLDKMVNQLCSKAEYVNELIRTYEEVSIIIYMRSEFIHGNFYEYLDKSHLNALQSHTSG